MNRFKSDNQLPGPSTSTSVRSSPGASSSSGPAVLVKRRDTWKERSGGEEREREKEPRKLKGKGKQKSHISSTGSTAPLVEEAGPSYATATGGGSSTGLGSTVPRNKKKDDERGVKQRRSVGLNIGNRVQNVVNRTKDKLSDALEDAMDFVDGK